MRRIPWGEEGAWLRCTFEAVEHLSPCLQQALGGGELLLGLGRLGVSEGQDRFMVLRAIERSSGQPQYR